MDTDLAGRHGEDDLLNACESLKVPCHVIRPEECSSHLSELDEYQLQEVLA